VKYELKKRRTGAEHQEKKQEKQRKENKEQRRRNETDESTEETSQHAFTITFAPFVSISRFAFFVSVHAISLCIFTVQVNYNSFEQ
jgi:hypothetical protein